MQIMNRDEARAAVVNGTVTSIDGRKPIAIGLVGSNEAVLLYFVHEDAEPCRWEGCAEHAVWWQEWTS